MGKINNEIPSEINYDKDFLSVLSDRFEPIKIQGASVNYSSEKHCFLLEIILAGTYKVKAVIPSGRTDYVSFALFEDNDMKIANHLTMERFITAIENFYADK